MESVIRTFIAAEISAGNRKKLDRIIRELKEIESSRNIRWVDPGNIHLTLKFLGDIPLGRVEEISRSMEEAASSSSPFNLYLRGSGCFPDPGRARVLWAGLELEKDSGLYVLHATLEKVMAAIGFPSENRPYHPHLTLARIRNPIGAERISRLLAAYETLDTVECVSDLVFMQSERRPQGSIYTPLYRVTLQAKS